MLVVWVMFVVLNIFINNLIVVLLVEGLLKDVEYFIVIELKYLFRYVYKVL